MTDYDSPRNVCPEATLSTNAYAEIGGVKHQITARGTTAQEMASNYFSAIDTLTAAYAARAQQVVIDPAKLLALLQCGMAKAAKTNDMDRAQRLVKAAAMVQAGAVVREGEEYVVTSQTDATQWYWINADFACTCPDWTRHAESAERYFCKHALSAMFFDRLTAGA